ncbi:27 kDa glycoprotein-like [Coccinella septempunctata]|uniref:27 kDa glycoprotein-like n=1 Tax=Coccinella septempunctata TaxID=41139 RepID=UPI001D0927D2|nr:27 kDa glycoprotein-like [Coccinella septempunctata]
MDLHLLFTFAFIFVGAYAQISNELDVDDIKKQIGENIPDIDLGAFDESKIPQADELDLIFRNKCDSKSGNGTYDNIQSSKNAYQECISNFVNVTELREEIEEAKKTGSMDEVFGKYCKKYPELSNCTDSFLESIQPCLEDNEKKSLNMSIALTHKLKEFICYKNGDRLAMFVAEGGVDCLQSQKDAIQQCLNSTLASRIPSDVTPSVFPVLLFDAQDCRDFGEFRTCVGKALGHCNETTPANLMDAFFKFFKKMTPCGVEQQKLESTKDAAFSLVPISSLVLIMTVLLVKLV